MKLRRCLLLLLAVIFLAAGVRTAAATGFGAYLSGAAGNSRGSYLPLSDNNTPSESSVRHYGGGFALDTGIDSDRLFRYRLHLGYDHIGISRSGLNDASLNGVMADNYFGFRIISGEDTTVWLAPEVRFGQHVGKDASGLALGLGAAVGFDFPLSPSLTLSFVSGYRETLNTFVLQDLTERLFHFDAALLWGNLRH